MGVRRYTRRGRLQSDRRQRRNARRYFMRTRMKEIKENRPRREYNKRHPGRKMRRALTRGRKFAP